MRLIWRWVPGFTWVQVCVSRRWMLRRDLMCSGLVRRYALGPVKVLTLRKGPPPARPETEEASHG